MDRWRGDGRAMLKEPARLKNVDTEAKSIDHILYSTSEADQASCKSGRDWGPKNQNEDKCKSQRMPIRPPLDLWCELEIPAETNSN